MFTFTIKRSTTSLEGVFDMGFPFIQLIHINFAMLWHLQLEIVCVVPQSMIQLIGSSWIYLDLFFPMPIRHMTMYVAMISDILFLVFISYHVYWGFHTNWWSYALMKWYQLYVPFYWIPDILLLCGLFPLVVDGVELYWYFPPWV